MKNQQKVVVFGLILGLVFGLSNISCTTKNKNEPANTVHTSSVAKIKGLDPAFADDQYAGIEASRAYEGLLQYHYLKRPYELIPNLAESMPQMSADGKTYTFKLKKGVLFQDDPCFKATNGKGRELTADDVVYSFMRLADPKLVSSGWWIFDGKIVGLNEWHDAAAKGAAPDYSAKIAGLMAVDRYTVQIKLVQRSYQFLYALAMPFTGIVPREAIEMYGKEFINHAVGTGPYRLQEYNPNAKIVWVKNPTYRQEFYPSEGAPGDKEAGLLADAGKPLPLNDMIIMQVFEESQPQWLSFKKGNLDSTGIPKDNFAEAIDTDGKLKSEFSGKNIALHKMPTLDLTHDTFNMMDPIIGKNKYLRQAISMAINTKRNIELFYNGRAVAAQGPIPPGLSGYDPDFKNPYREYNVEKAKEFLKKAGYPDGKGLAPIEFSTLSDTTSRQFNDAFGQDLKAIGLEVKFNAYSWPEFQASVKNRKAQMFGMAWGADYPDAENFLQLFYSKNMSPGPNDANYNNPEFDKLYEKSLLLPDGAERTAIYKQMVRLVVEDCPRIFGVHRIAFGLVHPWLKNYKQTEFPHGNGKYLRIDTSLRR